jgi:hypothetical protein
VTRALRYHVRQLAGASQADAFRTEDGGYAIHVSQHKSSKAAGGAIDRMLEGDRVEAFVWDSQLSRKVER